MTRREPPGQFLMVLSESMNQYDQPDRPHDDDNVERTVMIPQPELAAGSTLTRAMKGCVQPVKHSQVRQAKVVHLTVRVRTFFRREYAHGYGNTTFTE